MWQAEVRIDLDAIRHNVALLRAGTERRADGRRQGRRVRARHGAVAARPRSAGAAWLGVCTLDEALELRAAGITAPVLAWLHRPGCRCTRRSSRGRGPVRPPRGRLAELSRRSPAARRPAVHLKMRHRACARRRAGRDWPDLVEPPRRLQADGASRSSACGATLRTRTRPATRRSTPTRAFHRGAGGRAGVGITPSCGTWPTRPATLTRPTPTSTWSGRAGQSTGCRRCRAARLRAAPGDDRARAGCCSKRVPAGAASRTGTLPTTGGDDAGPGPDGLRRRDPARGSNRAPVALAGKDPDDRRPGMHGPGGRSTVATTGGRRRRGGPVRPARR
jgi:alanine racemase